jgi:hypothetical protein
VLKICWACGGNEFALIRHGGCADQHAACTHDVHYILLLAVQ